MGLVGFSLGPMMKGVEAGLKLEIIKNKSFIR